MEEPVPGSPADSLLLPFLIFIVVFPITRGRMSAYRIVTGLYPAGQWINLPRNSKICNMMPGCIARIIVRQCRIHVTGMFRHLQLRLNISPERVSQLKYPSGIIPSEYCHDPQNHCRLCPMPPAAGMRCPYLQGSSQAPERIRSLRADPRERGASR
jgi:hypothetical protein